MFVIAANTLGDAMRDSYASVFIKQSGYAGVADSAYAAEVSSSTSTSGSLESYGTSSPLIAPIWPGSQFPGQPVQVFGINFTKNTKVFFSKPQVYATTTFVNSDSLVFYMPFGLASGKYAIQLEDSGNFGNSYDVNIKKAPSVSVRKLSTVPVSQFVIGKSSNQNLLAFNISSDSAEITVQEIAFRISPTSSINVISVGGKTLSSFAGNTATVTGLGIKVPSGVSGVDLPVSVSYGSADIAANGGIGSQRNASTTLSVVGVRYITAVSPAITLTGAITSNPMQLVASKPMIAIPSTNISGLKNAEMKIGEIVIVAESTGNIKINRIGFELASTTGVKVSSPRIAEGSTTVIGSVCRFGAKLTCSFGTSSLIDGDGYAIPAGTSKTFSVFGVVSGVSATTSSFVSTKLDTSRFSFSWDDVNGGGTALDLARYHNYPTSSYSVRN